MLKTKHSVKIVGNKLVHKKQLKLQIYQMEAKGNFVLSTSSFLLLVYFRIIVLHILAVLQKTKPSLASGTFRSLFEILKQQTCPDAVASLKGNSYFILKLQKVNLFFFKLTVLFSELFVDIVFEILSRYRPVVFNMLPFVMQYLR